MYIRCDSDIHTESTQDVKKKKKQTWVCNEKK